MPTTLTAYRIFIASPGGLMEIRKCFRSIIDKYNTEDAVRRGVLFIPVGWEDTLGGVGRPQALINREVEECDALFLVLHDRWGSNPGAVEGYTSGTEEEFHKALECLGDADKPMTDISVFFKTVEPARLSDPGDQLKAVLGFKKKLEEEKSLLFQQFDDTAEFEGAVRMLLASWVRRHEKGAEGQGEAAASKPDEAAAWEREDRSGFEGVEGAPELGPRLAAESPDDPLPEAGSPLAAAADLAAQGRLTEAETLYAQLTAANSDAAAAFEYGEFLFRLGRKIQAEEYLRRAAEIADVVGDMAWIARSKAALGRLLAGKGDYDKGEAALREAAVVYREIGASVDLAAACLHLGEILTHKGQVREALEIYQFALEALEKENSPEISAGIFAALGQLNRDTGDLDSARKDYERAIEAKAAIGSESDLADMFAGYGGVLEEMGQLEDAKKAYESSLELFEREGKASGVADIADHLGHIYLALGNEADAEASFDRSAGVFETIQNFDGAVDAYISLGKIQTRRGRSDEAAASFRQALALVGRIKNKEEVSEILESLEKLITS